MKGRSFGESCDARQCDESSGSCRLEESREAITGLKFPTELKQYAVVCVESSATCNLVDDPFSVAPTSLLTIIGHKGKRY